MKDKIFLISQDKTLKEMEAMPYDKEKLLQDLLSEYPNLLAGYQMNEANPRRWLLVAPEMGIADDLAASERWSLDHLFLDQDGTPTLVEVKRATDTRIRREVAGQMLDYVANAILHWSPEVVRQRFEDRCKAKNIDPAEAVADLLDIESDDSDAIESFWETVFNKLKTGQVRLVFVADQIPKELRRIIEFLNEHMPDVEVLGVEMPQYVGFGLTTIVPKVIGKTSVAEQTKRTSGGQQWDEASFFDDLAARKGEAHIKIAHQILDWASQRELRIWWGKGKIDGSFIPVLDYANKSQQLFGIWSSGLFEFQFQYYKQPPFDAETKRLELLEKLNLIPGVALDKSKIYKRPSTSLDLFTDEAMLAKLLAAYDWFIDELHHGSVSG